MRFRVTPVPRRYPGCSDNKAWTRSHERAAQSYIGLSLGCRTSD